VLREKCGSPRKVAAIVWVPDVSEDVFSVAEIAPLAGPSVPVPSGEPLVSEKSTPPVGMPAPGAVTDTLAVNVTAWPKGERLLDDERAVLVRALFTVWIRGLVVAETAKLGPPW
jgi:hypothetical protein